MVTTLGNIRSINKGQSRPIQMVSCSRGLSKTMAFNLPPYLGIKTDGQVTAQDGYLTVTGASYATLLLSAKTNYAQNPKPITARILM